MNRCLSFFCILVVLACTPTEKTPCENGSCDPCGEDCEQPCVALADISDMIGNPVLFIGYPALATPTEKVSCAASRGRQISLSFTPRFSGDLVLTTEHPSTRANTHLEVTEATCDGEVLGCQTPMEGNRTRLQVTVTANRTYFVNVQVPAGSEEVFALSLHPAGTCESTPFEDITSLLFSGQLTGDTTGGFSSFTGSCGAEFRPERLLTFTPSFSGTLAATTWHPDTLSETVLHVREDRGPGSCSSPETEIACHAATLEPEGNFMHFHVTAGRQVFLFVDGDDPDGSGSGPFVLTLGPLHTSPALEHLQSCNHTANRDQFFFFATQGQAVQTRVDTVDAATAADTRLLIRTPDGLPFHEADDEVDCSFPPPQYRCPAHSFLAPVTGLYSIEVYVGSSERCFDRNRVNYELTLTVEGEHNELILARDR